MSETRIKIPSEMLKAAIAAVDKPNLSYEKNVSLRVEAALRWLRDYGHTLLNDVQLKELHDEWHSDKDNSGKHFYRWVINEALHRMFNEPKPGATCMIETPMVFTIPGSGRYSIGVDYGNGEDESVAVVIRVGENGKPDEQVATLHRDKATGKWVQETYPDPLVMYIMRHFEDASTDTQLIRNCAEAAAHDYEEHLKRNPAKDTPSGPVVQDYAEFEKEIAESREQDATAACPDLLLVDNSAAHKLHNECVVRAYNRGKFEGYAERSSETFGR